MNNYTFTSESVSEGHPDKVCDQISDAILDAYLKEDPNSRVACETMIKNNLVIIGGEITSEANPELEPVVRNVINNIGYNDDKLGFNGNTCQFINHISKQSPDIAQGVNEGEGEDLGQGAGDQGLMFGFACNETENLMPAPIDLAHKLVKKQSELRKSGKLGWLRPDAKSQVSVVYDKERKNIKRLSAIVLSTQHNENISYQELKDGIFEHVISPVIPKNWITNETKILINPTGKFVIGGPDGDTGLTGRKIVVDTYGGYAPHGGGAFSGKDCTKVDRSAAYMARYLAKNIVASKQANNCTVQLSYAIGVKEPTSVYVYADGKVRTDLADELKQKVDLTPKGIIERFDLFNLDLTKTTNYGHFGKENLPWEVVDLF